MSHELSPGLQCLRVGFMANINGASAGSEAGLGDLSLEQQT